MVGKSRHFLASLLLPSLEKERETKSYFQPSDGDHLPLHGVLELHHDVELDVEQLPGSVLQKPAFLKYCWVGFIISYFINFTDRPDDLHCHFHHPYQVWHIKTPDIILNIKVNNLNIYKIMKKIQLFPNNVWISYLTTTSLVVSSVTKEKKI